MCRLPTALLLCLLMPAMAFAAPTAARNQPYEALAAAIRAEPDRLVPLLEAALDSGGLNPPHVVDSALEAQPAAADIIVSTALRKSPPHYTAAIIQRAIQEGVEVSRFLLPAVTAAPARAEVILLQALRSAPQQKEAIIGSLATQPELATLGQQLARNLREPAAPSAPATTAAEPAPAGTAAEQDAPEHLPPLARNP